MQGKYAKNLAPALQEMWCLEFRDQLEKISVFPLTL